MKFNLPNDHPSYEGKLYRELTDEEREELRRDFEALEKLLDECGVSRLEDAHD